MAHFCHPYATTPLSSLHLPLPGIAQIGLWGGGPNGEDLEIVVQGDPIVKVTFSVTLTSTIPHVRLFEIVAVSAGATTLEAKVASTGASYAAPVRISVGVLDELDSLSLVHFYHGTSLEQAQKLISMDLVPMAVPEALLLDVNEYTDFGKGFYTHPDESKRKAVEWAKRRYGDWGVVRFGLTSDEVSHINPAPLHFPDKFRTRPANAPALFGSRPATWIEFVEFNRHVRTATIQRRKDNDWTADYGWMRGPIWGRADSGLPGAPGLPERYHQINWGLGGMNALNSDAAKRRRFLFTKHNERLL